YFKYSPQPQSIPLQVPLLKELLTKELPHWKTALPFADLTLVTDSSYTRVLLTDDDLYFNNLSVRHAHADIPVLLRQRNWPCQRVYSLQYWADKERMLGKLFKSERPEVKNLESSNLGS